MNEFVLADALMKATRAADQLIYWGVPPTDPTVNEYIYEAHSEIAGEMCAAGLLQTLPAVPLDADPDILASVFSGSSLLSTAQDMINIDAPHGADVVAYAGAVGGWPQLMAIVAGMLLDKVEAANGAQPQARKLHPRLPVCAYAAQASYFGGIILGYLAASAPEWTTALGGTVAGGVLGGGILSAASIGLAPAAAIAGTLTVTAFALHVACS